MGQSGGQENWDGCHEGRGAALTAWAGRGQGRAGWPCRRDARTTIGQKVGHPLQLPGGVPTGIESGLGLV